MENAKKLEIKNKTDLAKKKIREMKALKKNPVPKYYEMPEQTGNPEIDSVADLSALDAGFRARMKDEGKRFELATDTEYWVCMCFQSRDQKEQFLSELNLLRFGDKYIDGQDVAKELGVNLMTVDVPYNTSQKIDKTWASFVTEEV